MSTDVTRPEYAPLPEQPEENSWAFIAFAWRRKWIVLLLVLVGLGLGYLFYLQQTPIYQSVAQILIVRERARLPIDGIQISSSYDATHEMLIRSPLVLYSAAEKLDINSLPSLRATASPMSTIMSSLKVEMATDSGGDDLGDILVLYYKSPARGDCKTVLEAVTAAYEEFLGGTYQKESTEALKLIGEAKGQLDEQITAARAAHQRFKSEAELLFRGESAENVHEARLQAIETERSLVVLSSSKLQARIEAIEAALERGGSREALNLMVGQLDDSNVTQAGSTSGLPPASAVESQLFPLMLEEQMLLEKYGPDHPKVRTLRKQITLTREHLLGITTGEEPVDFFEVYLESLREQVRMNEKVMAELDGAFQQERDAAKQLAVEQATDEALRSEINRKEGLYNAVIARLEEINLARDSKGTRVELIYPPGIGVQVEPDLQKIMLASGLLGLLAGLGLAFLVDAADRRFRSPDEIRNELGLPVVGHIPILPGVEVKKKKARGESVPGELAPVLRVHHHPRGRAAEAYRAVRTALYFSTRGRGHQVIQVTSPSPGDGKTTLCGNLALSIANSGKKVLLIDADFRRPRIHRLFGAQNKIGISSVIHGEVEVDDAIQETEVENLHLLTCGPRPENPSELLTSKRFEELLDVVREKYDLVVVDTPPSLAVTDPLNVAPRVDGILLVLRLTKSARSAGGRALEALEGLGANVLGIVVNGVGGPTGYGGYGYGKYGYGGRKYSYGYAGYRYGSDYAYQYNYGNGYGDGYDDRTYYEDDDGRSKSGSHKRNGEED